MCGMADNLREYGRLLMYLIGHFTFRFVNVKITVYFIRDLIKLKRFNFRQTYQDRLDYANPGFKEEHVAPGELAPDGDIILPLGTEKVSVLRWNKSKNTVFSGFPNSRVPKLWGTYEDRCHVFWRER